MQLRRNGNRTATSTPLETQKDKKVGRSRVSLHAFAVLGIFQRNLALALCGNTNKHARMKVNNAADAE